MCTLMAWCPCWIQGLLLFQYCSEIHKWCLWILAFCMKFWVVFQNTRAHGFVLGGTAVSGECRAIWEPRRSGATRRGAWPPWPGEIEVSELYLWWWAKGRGKLCWAVSKVFQLNQLCTVFFTSRLELLSCAGSEHVGLGLSTVKKAGYH
jgi:hypothetical protein